MRLKLELDHCNLNYSQVLRQKGSVGNDAFPFILSVSEVFSCLFKHLIEDILICFNILYLLAC